MSLGGGSRISKCLSACGDAAALPTNSPGNEQQLLAFLDVMSGQTDGNESNIFNRPGKKADSWMSRLYAVEAELVGHGTAAADNSKWHPGVQILWDNYSGGRMESKAAYIHAGTADPGVPVFRDGWDIMAKSSMVSIDTSKIMKISVGALIYADTAAWNAGSAEWGMTEDAFQANFAVKVTKVKENGYHRVRLDLQQPEETGVVGRAGNSVVVKSHHLFPNVGGYLDEPIGPYKCVVLYTVVSGPSNQYIHMNISLRSENTNVSTSETESNSDTTTTTSGVKLSLTGNTTTTADIVFKNTLELGAKGDVTITLKLDGGDLLDMFIDLLPTGSSAEGHSVGGEKYKHKLEGLPLEETRIKGGSIGQLLESAADSAGLNPRLRSGASLASGALRKNIYALLLEFGEIKLTVGGNIAASMILEIASKTNLTIGLDGSADTSIQRVQESSSVIKKELSSSYVVNRSWEKTFTISFLEEPISLDEDLAGQVVRLTGRFKTARTRNATDPNAGAEFLPGEEEAIKTQWGFYSQNLKDAIARGFIREIRLIGSASNLDVPGETNNSENKKFAENRANALYNYVVSTEFLGGGYDLHAINSKKPTGSPNKIIVVDYPGEESDNNDDTFRYAQIEFVLGTP